MWADDVAISVLEEFAGHAGYGSWEYAVQAGLTIQRRSANKWQDWLDGKSREWVLQVKRDYARRARARMSDEQKARRNAYQRERAKRRGGWG